jgi:predicted nucleic acid-binding protein
MSVVIDASVALKWVFDEPGRDDADRLFDQDLIAPSLWLVEAADALWKRAQRGDLTPSQAQDRLVALRSAPLATLPLEDDLLEAATLALRLNHPVYDCLYLALALREKTYVVTADKRFCEAASRAPALSGAVRLLGAV